jgi:hypothetical protein
MKYLMLLLKNLGLNILSCVIYTVFFMAELMALLLKVEA